MTTTTSLASTQLLLGLHPRCGQKSLLSVLSTAVVRRIVKWESRPVATMKCWMDSIMPGRRHARKLVDGHTVWEAYIEERPKTKSVASDYCGRWTTRVNVALLPCSGPCEHTLLLEWDSGELRCSSMARPLWPYYMVNLQQSFSEGTTEERLSLAAPPRPIYRNKRRYGHSPKMPPSAAGSVERAMERAAIASQYAMTQMCPQAPASIGMNMEACEEHVEKTWQRFEEIRRRLVEVVPEVKAWFAAHP